MNENENQNEPLDPTTDDATAFMIRFQEKMADDAHMIADAAKGLREIEDGLEKLQKNGGQEVTHLRQAIECLRNTEAAISKHVKEMKRGYFFRWRTATLLAVAIFSVGTAAGVVGVVFRLADYTGLKPSAIALTIFGLG